MSVSHTWQHIVHRVGAFIGHELLPWFKPISFIFCFKIFFFRFGLPLFPSSFNEFLVKFVDEISFLENSFLDVCACNLGNNIIEMPLDLLLQISFRLSLKLPVILLQVSNGLVDRLSLIENKNKLTIRSFGSLCFSVT
jgi:hypothetical protein